MSPCLRNYTFQLNCCCCSSEAIKGTLWRTWATLDVCSKIFIIGSSLPIIVPFPYWLVVGSCRWWWSRRDRTKRGSEEDLKKNSSWAADRYGTCLVTTTKENTFTHRDRFIMWPRRGRRTRPRTEEEKFRSKVKVGWCDVFVLWQTGWPAAVDQKAGSEVILISSHWWPQWLNLLWKCR